MLTLYSTKILLWFVLLVNGLLKALLWLLSLLFWVLNFEGLFLEMIPPNCFELSVSIDDSSVIVLNEPPPNLFEVTGGGLFPFLSNKLLALWIGLLSLANGLFFLNSNV